MESSFARVKSIIERLRDVLKCQKCLQMKNEEFMIFYHVCDHFYCFDCQGSDKNCPLCQNPLDEPTNVVNDTNILSLYQSLSKFELPSREEIEKIYQTHKKDKLKETSKEKLFSKKSVVKDTNKNYKREVKKTNLTSPESETILLSSGENKSNDTPKGVYIRNEKPLSINRSRNKITPARKKNVDDTIVGVTTTPVSGDKNEIFTSTKPTPTVLLNSVESLKGNVSINKSKVNKRNPKGETPLHSACKKCNFTAMKELIDAGANINAQDNAGWTPLHDSIFSGNYEVIKFLLDNGANVNTPGLENTTALHEAVAKGNTEIIKLLLDYGADINAMNIFKETPLDLVVKYQLDEMKDLFSEASKTLKKKKKLVLTEEAEQNFIIYKYNLPVEDEKLVNKFIDKFGGDIISSLTSKICPSHIVIPDEKIEMTWALVSAVPMGCFVVTSEWIKQSLNENAPKPANDFEPNSPIFSGFSKARANKLNQLPKLFSGCHFFFGGNFDHYNVKNLTFGKEDLKAFVEKNGGVIVRRCPDPESLALEKTIPFHAPATSSLRETSYYIIYYAEKWDPKPKYNMSHMKTLPIEWLLNCVLQFELIDPNEKSRETFF